MDVAVTRTIDGWGERQRLHVRSDFGGNSTEKRQRLAVAKEKLVNRAHRLFDQMSRIEAEALSSRDEIVRRAMQMRKGFAHGMAECAIDRRMLNLADVRK